MTGALKKFLFTAAVLAVSQLFSGKLESSELFYNALKRPDPAEAAELLIEAAKADPANAEAPLAMLLGLKLNPGAGLQICNRYDKLWKENPADTDIAFFGTILYRTYRIEPDAVLKNLKLVPDFGKSYSSSPEKKNRKLTLELDRLLLHLTCGDNKDGVIYTSKLDAGQHGLALSCFYNTMALRCKVAGNDAGYKEMVSKCKEASDIWFSVNEKADLSYWLEAVKLAAKEGNQHLVSTIFKKLEKSLTDPRQLNVARITFIENTRDFNAAVSETAKLKKVPPQAKNHLLFYAALRAKKIAEAKKLVKNVPEKERANAIMDIALTSCDPELLKSVISSGKYNANFAGELKLLAASVCKDTKLYYEARSALKDRQVTGELANSIGYTAAELGVDMEEAGKLLNLAVELNPYNAANLDSLAFWKFRQQLYAEAQVLIEKAISVISHNVPAATLLEHAGDIYRAQGNFYQAEKCYRRALMFSEDDPGCDPARVEKKLLEYK